jgi:hypothetical protein
LVEDGRSAQQEGTPPRGRGLGWWRRRESNPRPKPLSFSVYMLVLRLPTLARPGGPPGNGWIAILTGLFFVPCTYATEVVRTSLVLTRPNLKPRHCQVGRRPREGLMAPSLRCGHREVLVVVGTCGGFSGVLRGTEHLGMQPRPTATLSKPFRPLCWMDPGGGEGGAARLGHAAQYGAGRGERQARARGDWQPGGSRPLTNRGSAAHPGPW